MVVGGGFEPPKLTRQIYSLIPLTTREPHRNLLLITFVCYQQAANFDNSTYKKQVIYLQNSGS